MNELAGALADAGTDQRILFGRLLTETDLTAARERRLDSVIAGVEFQVSRLLVHIGTNFIAHFQDHVLYSAEPNHVASSCVNYIVPKGYPSTPYYFS